MIPVQPQHDAQLLIFFYAEISVPLFRDQLHFDFFFHKCLIIVVVLPRILAPHPVLRNTYLKDT